MAHAISPARALKIKGKPRHRLGATREYTLQITDSNLLKAQRDTLDARSACLVHRVGWHFLGNTAANGNLTRRIWSAARLTSVAEDRLFHLLRLNPGALDSRLGRDHSHARGGLRSKCAAKLPNRRANRRHDVHAVQ